MSRRLIFTGVFNDCDSYGTDTALFERCAFVALSSKVGPGVANRPPPLFPTGAKALRP